MADFKSMLETTKAKQAEVDYAVNRERTDREAKHQAMVQAGITALQPAVALIAEAAKAFAADGIKITRQDGLRLEDNGTSGRVWPCYCFTFGQEGYTRNSGILVIASDGKRFVSSRDNTFYQRDRGYVVGDALKAVGIDQMLSRVEADIAEALKEHIRSRQNWAG